MHHHSAQINRLRLCSDAPTARTGLLSFRPGTGTGTTHLVAIQVNLKGMAEVELGQANLDGLGLGRRLESPLLILGSASWPEHAE
jgi:hypothetical protein